MKKLLSSVCIIIFLSACDGGWDGENRDMFRQSCMEEAKGWAGSEEKAKPYCDCVLEKIMKKYPRLNDALENLDSIAVDPTLKDCRQ